MATFNMSPPGGCPEMTATTASLGLYPEILKYGAADVSAFLRHYVLR